MPDRHAIVLEVVSEAVYTPSQSVMVWATVVVPLLAGHHATQRGRGVLRTAALPGHGDLRSATVPASDPTLPSRRCPTIRLAAYAREIANHYDVLGLEPGASPQEIRIAYRERARRHHPDRAGVAPDMSDVEMSRINEAYRVLGDPGRRAIYDRSLAGTNTDVDTELDTDLDPLAGMDRADTVARDSVLSPSGPARVPWKLMAVAAIIGSAAVVIGATFNDPPSEEVPDGILRVGSCVAIEANGDAREVACTNTGDDLVVELIIPTDAECPHPLAPHRDRLGLGVACTDDR